MDGWESDGEMMRSAYTLRAQDDDLTQPGILVRDVFSDSDRNELVETVSGSLLKTRRPHLPIDIRHARAH